MKISILTFGSAGDVVPYIALALGLMERKHEVILAAPQNFEELIKSYSIHYMPLQGNTQELLDSEHGIKLLASGNVKSFMKEVNQLTFDTRHQFHRDVMASCKDADLIISGTLMLYYSAFMSEKLQKPFMIAIVNPVFVRTKSFPQFLVAPKPLPFRFLNAYSYKLVFKTYQRQKSKEFIEWRNELGLKPNSRLVTSQTIKLKAPVVHGYSPSLLAKPGDWGNLVSVSGVWKPDEKNKKRQPPSEELINWIKNGEAPIYFGFGSMPVSDPKTMQEMILEICKEKKLRGIIHAGWSKFSTNKSDIDSPIYFLNEFVDLEWLFPQCSILVHHGGVGTTHLGIEAGVPTLICSIFADNPLWGELVKKHNIGRHIPYKKLNKQKLMKALMELKDEKIRQNTVHLGHKLKEENGLKNALDFIEENISNAPVYSNDI
jgi:UDP:flavonoid glycosyltransferase YjiC (YdhE family)